MLDLISQDPRLGAGVEWVASVLGKPVTRLSPVSGDASLRRYFRIHDDTDLILMDSPPEHEDNQRFIDIAQRIHQAGLHVPKILASNLELGILLLEDLGDDLYKAHITEDAGPEVFTDIFTALKRLATDVNVQGLPDYDAQRLQDELDLFPDWYLDIHLKQPLTPDEKIIWQKLCKRLIDSAQAQQQVFVHRDFHSCNLLKTTINNPGIIDFQDAVRGPISYDFISLIWDRFIPWPRTRLEAWMECFRLQLDIDRPSQAWIQDCDWMGLQRNIKVVGIFARLFHRDGKSGYVEMIPRFYQYLLDVLPLYPEFDEFLSIVKNRMPASLQKDFSCAP